jgi:hypothetical protein
MVNFNVKSLVKLNFMVNLKFRPSKLYHELVYVVSTLILAKKNMQNHLFFYEI